MNINYSYSLRDYFLSNFEQETEIVSVTSLPSSASPNMLEYNGSCSHCVIKDGRHAKPYKKAYWSLNRLFKNLFFSYKSSFKVLTVFHRKEEYDKD